MLLELLPDDVLNRGRNMGKLPAANREEPLGSEPASDINHYARNIHPIQRRKDGDEINARRFLDTVLDRNISNKSRDV